MKYPVEQVGWLVVGLLLGGLIAYSTNTLGADPIVSEQTVTTKRWFDERTALVETRQQETEERLMKIINAELRNRLADQ